MNNEYNDRVKIKIDRTHRKDPPDKYIYITRHTKII